MCSSDLAAALDTTHTHIIHTTPHHTHTHTHVLSLSVMYSQRHTHIHTPGIQAGNVSRGDRLTVFFVAASQSKSEVLNAGLAAAALDGIVN